MHITPSRWSCPPFPLGAGRVEKRHVELDRLDRRLDSLQVGAAHCYACSAVQEGSPGEQQRATTPSEQMQQLEQVCTRVCLRSATQRRLAHVAAALTTGHQAGTLWGGGGSGGGAGGALLPVPAQVRGATYLRHIPQMLLRCRMSQNTSGGGGAKRREGVRCPRACKVMHASRGAPPGWQGRHTWTCSAAHPMRQGRARADGWHLAPVATCTPAPNLPPQVPQPGVARGLAGAARSGTAGRGRGGRQVGRCWCQGCR